MLSMRIIAAVLAGLVFASGAYAQTSLKDQSPETAKALKLSEEAVAAGKQGQADALVAKAEEAKTQAIYASKNFTSYNLQIALERLGEAITEGKKGDVAAATAKAQAAVEVLGSSSPEDANLP
jgi:small metal-binding protein